MFERRANYEIVSDTPERLVIRDLGPWNRHWTVTNDAERVVEELRDRLTAGKRLFYFDSAGELDEIVHEDGRFISFRPGDKPA